MKKGTENALATFHSDYQFKNWKKEEDVNIFYGQDAV